MTIDNIRVGKVLKEFNIGLGTLVDYLKSKKIEIEASPGTKLTPEVYEIIRKEFGKEQIIKEQSKKIAIKVKDITDKADVHDNEDTEDDIPVKEVFIKTSVVEPPSPKIVGKIDIDRINRPAPQPVQSQPAPAQPAPVPQTPVQQTPVQQIPVQQTPVQQTPVQQTPAQPAPAQSVSAEAPQVQAVKQVSEPAVSEVKPVQPANQEVDNERKRAEQREREERERLVARVKREQQDREEREKAAAKVREAAEQKESEKPVRDQNTAPVIEHIETKVERLSGPKISGTMDLSQFEKKKPEQKPSVKEGHKGKRERIRKPHKEKVDLSKESKDNTFRPGADKNRPNPNNKKNDKKPIGKDKFKPVRNEVDEDAVQKQIKETYLRMVEGKGKTKGSKYRRDKRDHISQRMQEEIEKEQISSSTLKVTEFVTVNDLAMMMDVPVTKVIEACMNLGLMVSINQRLDAEAMVLVAEEFGFKVEFVTADIQDSIQEDEDTEEQLVTRPPIVTVMGHVDHGKTSLLDYIRKANVIAGEAGGITQHIGAYNVKIPTGERITFLDTPGHEAFTAMRARGAKVTDLAIIIVAADDAVMPQTREAINHAQAAGVPMIFAINKMDKPGANPERIREQLANMNLLVEDWGGKYQCQEISAKQGVNVDKLLEKILLEAELLELKANPDKRAKGTVIESSLDKGRGYVTTILVQNGTLKMGDIMLSGSYTGRVKAMFNERGMKITEAGPATPVSILGLNGAPAAGELFNVMEDEKEARDIANKREQLLRIQGLKTQKHITLEEIGRRIAIGNFQELNIIVKGDVDGSIEALSDSLIKLSNEEVHVNVIHKAVGAISESDVLLAAASNAIIIGFQVRPSVSARKLAEKEEIEIRLYSVIYDAINEVKDGIEGMLAPEQKEEITATAEVREVFKISKVGSIAGCMVKEGKLIRNAKVRIIRDGIVVYTGGLGSLKRFKDDVKEVSAGYDCGLNIDGYNDIKTGDMIESYTIVEIKRKL
ncbi:MAG: translation initiation factor IF-2 [Bacteroidales bacterium]